MTGVGLLVSRAIFPAQMSPFLYKGWGQPHFPVNPWALDKGIAHCPIRSLSLSLSLSLSRSLALSLSVCVCARALGI